MHHVMPMQSVETLLVATNVHVLLVLKAMGSHVKVFDMQLA